MQKKNQRQQKNKKQGEKFGLLVEKTINSGQLWFDKGDLKIGDYLVERKETDLKGYRISTKVLRKIWDEALTANKLPAMIICIEDDIDRGIVWLLQVKIERKRK